ncbi:hypothetical protein [Methylotuvimicrobium sp.]
MDPDKKKVFEQLCASQDLIPSQNDGRSYRCQERDK